MNSTFSISVVIIEQVVIYLIFFNFCLTEVSLLEINVSYFKCTLKKKVGNFTPFVLVKPVDIGVALLMISGFVSFLFYFTSGTSVQIFLILLYWKQTCLIKSVLQIIYLI